MYTSGRYRCILALLTAALFSAPAPAVARLVGYCTNVDDLIEQSDLIVVAHVVSASAPMLDGWTTLQVHVEEVFRGRVRGDSLAVQLGPIPGDLPDAENVPNGWRYLLFLREVEGRLVGVDCPGDRLSLEPRIEIPSRELPVRERILKLLETNLACREREIERTAKELEQFAGIGEPGGPFDPLVVERLDQLIELVDDPCQARSFTIGLD